MRKELEVNKNLIASCYPAMGVGLGILQSHQEMDEWVYNHFLQIFSTDEQTIDFYDFNVSCCPFIDYGELKLDVVKQLNFEKFIDEMIDNNYYLSFFVDTQKIKAYGTKMGLHPIFIYGYDNEKGVFLSADHFTRGIFSFKEIDKEEVINAMVQNEEIKRIEQRFRWDYKTIQYYRFDPYRHKTKVKLQECEYGTYIDCKQIRDGILAYIEARPCLNVCARMLDVPQSVYKRTYWGKDTYRILQEYVQDLKDKNQKPKMGIQGFYVMYVYKKIMSKRLYYLAKKGYVDVEKELLKNMEELEKEAYLICLLFIKKFIDNKNATEGEINSLVKKLEIMKGRELRLYEKMMRKLDTSV